MTKITSTMIQAYFILCLITLFLEEARHDFFVIKHDKRWHHASVQMHLTTIIAMAVIAILGVDYIRLLVFYPILRGLIFWPTLNILLGWHHFHLSDHFMERWFKKGWHLFTVYIVLFVLALIFAINYN